MHIVATGSGHPVLFLHGIPTSCQLWTGIIARMSGDFKCFAVDLPGLGRAGDTRPDFRDLPKLAAALDGIRIEQAIDKWHLVGHDAGCAIVVHYARQFPERVGCMALMSPSMFPDLKPFFLFEILRKRILGELLAPLVSLVFWRCAMQSALDWNRDFRAALSDFHAPFSGLRGPWRLMSLVRWGNPNEVLASIPGILPEIWAPTLIFHGSQDPAVPASFARRAAVLIPNAELVVLDSGHFFPLREPELVAAALGRFFDIRETGMPSSVDYDAIRATVRG
jgi:pimeloyl-ACP methyl ester carboxylesterase